jgi:hypothetical protein
VNKPTPSVSIPVGSVKAGVNIRANDAGEVKTVARLESARVAGYKIAVFVDGTQKALGHKSDLVLTYNV